MKKYVSIEKSEILSLSIRKDFVSIFLPKKDVTSDIISIPDEDTIILIP